MLAQPVRHNLTQIPRTRTGSCYFGQPKLHDLVFPDACRGCGGRRAVSRPGENNLVLCCYLRRRIADLGPILSTCRSRNGHFIARLASVFLIGVGTGGIKANVNPLLAEQYTSPGPVFRLLKSGEKVVIDRDLTVQRSVPRLPSYAKFDSRQDVCNLFSLYQHRLSCCSGFGRNRTILRVLGSIRHPNDRLDHWLHSIRDQQRPVYQ